MGRLQLLTLKHGPGQSLCTNLRSAPHLKQLTVLTAQSPVEVSYMAHELAAWAPAEVVQFKERLQGFQLIAPAVAMRAPMANLQVMLWLPPQPAIADVYVTGRGKKVAAEATRGAAKHILPNLERVHMSLGSDSEDEEELW